MFVQFDFKTLLKYQSQAIVAASFACVVGLGYISASIGWQVIDSPVIEVPRLGSVVATNTSSDGVSNYNIMEIKNWHLFGQTLKVADVKQEAVEPVALPVQETRLPLTLLGIFAAPDPKMSSAVIATSSTKSQGGEYFKIGQEVQSGVVLVNVLNDQVVLKVRGKDEVLKFEEVAGLQPSVKSTNTTRPPNASRYNPAAPIKSVDKGAIKSPEDFMKVAKTQLTTNPVGALASVGLEAVSNDGSTSGYKIGTGAASKNLTKYGLQPGDVVISINDIAVGNVEADKGLIDEIFDSGTAKVVIQRGDFRFTVNHKF